MGGLIRTGVISERDPDLSAAAGFGMVRDDGANFDHTFWVVDRHLSQSSVPRIPWDYDLRTKGDL
jgi:hypothetical protein